MIAKFDVHHGDVPGEQGNAFPNNWSGGRKLACPPKFVVFVSTVSSEEYNTPNVTSKLIQI